MATYIPGVPQYFPKLETFTPDYKFLANILDAKTTRYNTGYKAVNDLYSKVVYGDLSRGDTQEMRDQYANNLGPKLQQVSGMDLSVMQNVEAAKGLFKPFFEEDIIVKDLVTTTQYKNDMRYANMLQNSPIKDQREMYWQTGVEKMQYEMQDFVNASEEDALSMSAPKYVPDSDLYESARAYLKEQNFNVKITEPSKDGMWMITRKNGDLVTRQALQAVQKALKDDPRVVNAYRADAFVKSRRFADKGVEAGQFASVRDGQAAWATEQIGRVEELIAAKNVKLRDDVEKQKKINVSWENYSQQYGVIPGTEESKIMNEAESRYKATIDALNGNRNELADNKGVNEQEHNSLLNRAYGLLMHYNMEDDLQAAAIAYSNIDKEVGLEPNPYGLKKVQFQYDVAKINMNAQAKKDLEAIKHANELKEIDYELGGGAQGQKLSNMLGSMNAQFGLPGTISGVTNEKGELPEDYNFLEYQDEIRGEMLIGIQSEQLDLALDAYRQIMPSSTGIYNIKGFTGSLQDIKLQMKNHPEMVEDLFTEMAEYFKGASVSGGSLAGGAGPKFVADMDGRGYQNLAKKFRTAIGHRRQLDAASAGLYKTANENFIRALASPITEDQEQLGNLFKAGIPKIFKTINQGTKAESIDMLSRDEYIEQVVAYAKQNEVNIEESGLSDNEGSLGYVERSVTDVQNPLMGGQQVGGVAASLQAGLQGLVGNVPASSRKVFDNTIAEMQAGEIYDKQRSVINATLNGSLNRVAASSLEEGVPYTPLYKEYDVKQALRGVDPALMNTGEIANNPTYDVLLDPLNPSESAVQLLESFYKQIKTTPSQDIHFYSGKVGSDPRTQDDIGSNWGARLAAGLLLGGVPNIVGIDQYDDIEEVIEDREMGEGDIAEKLINLYLQDLNRMQVKGATKSDYPAATLSYQPHIQSDPNKLESEYAQASITFDHEWLDQYTKKGGFLEDKALKDYETASYLVKKSSDLNPLRYGEYNFSNVASTISTSEEAQYYEPVIRGGEIRVFQDGSGNYIAETMPVIWDQKIGGYKYVGSGSKNLGSDRYTLDNEVGKIIEGLNIVANQNYINEMNAKKSQK